MPKDKSYNLKSQGQTEPSAESISLLDGYADAMVALNEVKANVLCFFILVHQ
jgi:hypothetical protein